MEQIKDVGKVGVNSFKEVVGRRFAVYYRLAYHQDPKIGCFEGVCENFSIRNCAFSDEKYGFNVIDYSLIVSLIDITK